jgi:molecular chaperone DnaJ
MAKDYYSALGVAENASQDEIKKAFRRLAKQYHPDRNKGDKNAENKFKEISEAHDVLSDPQKRQQYDAMRKYGGYDPRYAQAGGGFDPSQFQQGFRFEDLGGFGSFADIFSSIFGDEDIFSRAGGRRRATRGHDIEIPLEITFEESVSGASKTIGLTIPESCNICGGSGSEPGTGQTVCPQCGGRGTVSYAQGQFAVSRPCPRCLGKGVLPGKPCHNCGGAGKIKTRKKIKIKIPAGVENGGHIRLRGMGSPGNNGGPNGDLIITVSVKKHQQFERKGNDIYTKATISFPEAALGCKTKIKTLTKEVNITIPPGTAHGTLLRLKGLGLSVNGAQGDQYVEINIDVPKNLTEKQKELLEELAKTM